jgi:negative modulator of initiation of replication
MKQIDLDDDLAEFLLAQERLTGVSPSDFLKAALRRQRTRQRVPRERTAGEPRQRSASGQMAVFLRILTEMQGKYPETFERIANVRGRGRIYFAKSAAEIEASGNSTNPQLIPGTEWWAIGTTSTPEKAKILGRVLHEVGCSREDRERWEADFGCTISDPPRVWGEESPEEDDPFRI